MIDAEEVSETPARIPLPFREGIKEIACGSHSSLILTMEGDVYCCGEGGYGVVGNDIVSKNTFTFVKVLEGIESINCGSRHCLASNKYGMVYGWGDNQQGQLGSKSFGKVVTKPRLLDIRNVKEISANRNISLFFKGTPIIMKVRTSTAVEGMTWASWEWATKTSCGRCPESPSSATTSSKWRLGTTRLPIHPLGSITSLGAGHSESFCCLSRWTSQR